MTDRARKLFADTGLDPDDHRAVLSMILASPQAVANNLGVGPTVHLTAELSAKYATQFGAAALRQLLNEVQEMPVYPTGALPPQE